jgi:hypothetical protein
LKRANNNHRAGAVARPLLAAALAFGACAIPAHAQEQPTDAPRREFNEADQQAIHEAQQRFNGCTDQASAESLSEYADVRRVLGVAVEHCAGVLEELNRTLLANGLDQGLLYGVVRGIKSRTIQRLLPQLMAARAQQQQQQVPTGP